MNPAQRSARGQPLIEVAHENDDARAFLGKRVQQFFYLESALDGQESEMRDDHAHDFAIDFQIGVDRAARFAAPITEIQVPDSVNFVACQQDIAVVPIGAFHRGSRNGIVAGGGGEIIHLMKLFDAARIRMDFLKTDDLRAAFLDHLGDTLWIAAAIGADALMNIVGQDREALHAMGGVNVFRLVVKAVTFVGAPGSAWQQTSGETHKFRAA